MKMEPGLCAICKGSLNDSEYKVSSSHVCEDCYKEDYLTAVETGEVLGMHDSSVSKYKRLKRYDIVPRQDAIRCISNPLWKRSSVLEFKKTIPVFNLIQLDILTELGLLRYEIADVLGVNKFWLNKFCNEHGIPSNFVNKTMAANDSEHLEFKKFDRAHKLLNKSIKIRGRAKCG